MSPNPNHRLPAPLRPPVNFECTACLATHNSADHHIPVGWSQHGSAIWCNDCTNTAATRSHGGHSPRNRTAIK